MAFLNRFCIKSRLTALLLGVSLGSLLAAGILSWFRFRKAFEERTFAQLTSVRAAKGYQIESYMQSLRNHIETLSEDRMVVSAMVELNSAYKELQNQVISIEWQNKIEAFYGQEFFPRLSKTIQGEQVCLMDAMGQIQQGKDDVKVTLNRQDEFGELGVAFNSLVQDMRVKTEQIDRKTLENKALLLNILPDVVVARVKQGEEQIADFVQQTTVLWANIVGLSQLSQGNDSGVLSRLKNLVRSG